VKLEIQKERQDFPDQKLMQEIADKQKWAFSIIYDRHSAMLFGLALKILHDRSSAEDVLQELFLSVWEKADKFKTERGNAVAWMTILCRNKCIDKLRKLEVNKQRSTELDEESVIQVKAHQSSDDQFDLAGQAILQKSVAEAMAELPGEQKQLIEMAFFSGFTQSEIAGELKLPLGTVKTRIRSGMKKLHDILKEKMI